MQLENIFENNNSLGRWEYDANSDAILLSETAANIYYNNAQKNRVYIEDFFSILLPKSLQHTLSALSGDSDIFMQNILCSDGNIKKILVITLSNSKKTGIIQAFSVDVTKIL